jgi:uncharacterized protein involved in exopolysaccharide biosynthesis
VNDSSSSSSSPILSKLKQLRDQLEQQQIAHETECRQWQQKHEQVSSDLQIAKEQVTQVVKQLTAHLPHRESMVTVLQQEFIAAQQQVWICSSVCVCQES